MRIAVVNRSPRVVGGVERYLASSIPMLIAAGHDVALWHDNAPEAVDARKPLVPVERSGIDWTNAGANAAQAELRRWRPDVICVHSQVPREIERRILDAAPAIFFGHGYLGTCISGTKTLRDPQPRPCHRTLGPLCLAHYYPHRCGGLDPRTMVRDYSRNVAQLASFRRYRSIVTFSSHMHAEYIRHRISPERVVLIRPFTPGPAASATGVKRPPDDSALILGFVGRLEDLKGVELLLDALPGIAARLNRRIRLRVAGAGRERDRLVNRAQQVVASNTMVDIAFDEWLDEASLQRFYTSIDLLAVPSIWPEPFGLVGLEAAACGVPAAGFAVGGIPDWLRDGLNGHIARADPPRAESIGDAVVRCLQDTQHYRLLQAGARSVAAEFSASSHIRELGKLFSRVADVA